MKNEKCTAVVLAAGSGKRMQSSVAKQYLLLNGKPVLWYALQAFEQSPIIHNIILVVGKGEIPYCRTEMVEKYHFQKVSAVIEGGAERYLSVWQALKILEDSSYVFIHDGARPFVTEQMIQDTYKAVCETGACVAAMPVKDTIKIADEKDFAIQTPNRRQVWAVQTPQVFEKNLICKAYKKLIEQLAENKVRAAQNLPPLYSLEITDDAMVVESLLNIQVKLVKTSYKNIKITTPEDMVIAESFLND